MPDIATGLDDPDKADWYFNRAAKVRVMGEAITDTAKRNVFFQMAEDYERLADACAAPRRIRK
jgi:hypothetical protein